MTIQEVASLGGKAGGPARAKALTAEEREAIARMGGLAGGDARAKKLTAAQRKAIAKKAAAARWANAKAAKKKEG